jgi:hypothetical protein
MGPDGARIARVLARIPRRRAAGWPERGLQGAVGGICSGRRASVSRQAIGGTWARMGSESRSDLGAYSRGRAAGWLERGPQGQWEAFAPVGASSFPSIGIGGTWAGWGREPRSDLGAYSAGCVPASFAIARIKGAGRDCRSGRVPCSIHPCRAGGSPPLRSRARSGLQAGPAVVFDPIHPAMPSSTPQCPRAYRARVACLEHGWLTAYGLRLTAYCLLLTADD